MIEQGWLPSRAVVAIGAGRDSVGLGELRTVNFLMALLGWGAALKSALIRSNDRLRNRPVSGPPGVVSSCLLMLGHSMRCDSVAGDDHLCYACRIKIAAIAAAVLVAIGVVSYLAPMGV